MFSLVGAVSVIHLEVFYIPTTLIAIATIFALLYIKKIQEPCIIAVAAVLGIVIKLML